MEFTFDESVHLIDTYTDKMMQNIENPLRYQLRVALYNLSNHSPSEEKLQEAWDDGFDKLVAEAETDKEKYSLKQMWNTYKQGVSTEDYVREEYERGYSNGYDAGYEEADRYND